MSRYYITSTIFLTLFISSLIIDGAVDIPMGWYIFLATIYLTLVIAGTIMLSLKFFVAAKNSGQDKGIALTFDDGPVPGKTERILDLLKERNLKAAFFCIGKNVDQYPEIARRIHDEGHVIGNHTYSHTPAFDLQSSTIVAKELTDTDSTLFKVIGKRPRFFRPPYGVTNPMIAKAVRIKNYTVVGWSVRSFDTVTRDPQKLYKRVTGSLQTGDIVLFHDRCESMHEILPEFLDHLEKVGLKVVRVDELLNEKAYA